MEGDGGDGGQWRWTERDGGVMEGYGGGMEGDGGEQREMEGDGGRYKGAEGVEGDGQMKGDGGD